MTTHRHPMTAKIMAAAAFVLSSKAGPTAAASADPDDVGANTRSGAATTGPYRRGPIGRRLHYLGHILIELFVRHLAKRLLSSPVAAKVLTRLPHMPTRFVPWLASPATAWTQQIGEPPQEVRTVAGIQRDPAAEADAYDKTPLHYFFRLHADALAALLPVATMIAPAVTTAPRVESSTRQLIARQDEKPERSPAQTDPVMLTAEFKKYAATLGVSATGVTPFDPKLRRSHALQH